MCKIFLVWYGPICLFFILLHLLEEKDKKKNNIAKTDVKEHTIYFFF